MRGECWKKAFYVKILGFSIYRVWETCEMCFPPGVTISVFRLLNNKENCHFSGMPSVCPSFRVGGMIQKQGGREAVQILAFRHWQLRLLVRVLGLGEGGWGGWVAFRCYKLSSEQLSVMGLGLPGFLCQRCRSFSGLPRPHPVLISVLPLPSVAVGKPSGSQDLRTMRHSRKSLVPEFSFSKRLLSDSDC